MPHAIEAIFRPAGRAGRSLLLAMALAGCAEMPAWSGLGPATSPAPLAEAPPPMDPVTTFAAGAAPGAQGMVTLAGGGSARVRLQRVYFAASGRECREVLVGSGLEERASLICQQGGGWAPARPLLRGGSPRP